MSEIARYRHLVLRYCYDAEDNPAPVLDIGSQGDPVCPWAWSLDLPHDAFAYYNSGHAPRGPIQIRADGFTHCAAEPGTLWAVVSSHLLEDVAEGDWDRVLALWASMLKPGGYLIILTPERNLWAAAIARGQTPNCSHCYEPLVGDVGRHGASVGLEIVEDRLTALDPNDYSILTVLRRP